MLGSKTSSEACSIIIKGNYKWKTLIQNSRKTTIMSWVNDVLKFRHDIFLSFIECKIDNQGNWDKADPFPYKTEHQLLRAMNNSEHNTVTIIEPDGLRRNFLVRQGGSISMYQNVVSYNSGFISEIIVDEKAQAGKGKKRDILE